MRIGLFIITAFWFFPVSAQTLRIMGSDDGFLPFYYGNNLSMGILIEVINDFTLETGIEAEFRPMARKRQ
ncbi:MAG TPA: polar amino acid ABC transporter substrate-binding protein, partial [Marinobacter sp.]